MTNLGLPGGLVFEELFFLDKTNMLFGDAKDTIEGMIKEVRELD